MRKQPLFNNANRAAMLALLLAGVLAMPALAAGAPPGKPGSAWRDDFPGSTLNTQFWVIATGQAPGTIPGVNLGDYDPSHVTIVTEGTASYLQLLLTQETAPSGTGTLSHGALIYTKNRYGYGTYEWRMRMSSTSATPNGSGDAVSGSVSAGFVYYNNSQTEIDFEFSALDPDTLYMVNWRNRQPRSAPTSDDRTYSTLYPLTVSTDFHDYKFVWQRGKITFYVDGVVEAISTTNVPSAQAYFMINHWGTDNGGPNGWGGAATTGTSRYFYVDWVQFTPLP